MDIEQYINDELQRQQQAMRQVGSRPLAQLQLPSKKLPVEQPKNNKKLAEQQPQCSRKVLQPSRTVPEEKQPQTAFPPLEPSKKFPEEQLLNNIKLEEEQPQCSTKVFQPITTLPEEQPETNRQLFPPLEPSKKFPEEQPQNNIKLEEEQPQCSRKVFQPITTLPEEQQPQRSRKLTEEQKKQLQIASGIYFKSQQSEEQPEPIVMLSMQHLRLPSKELLEDPSRIIWKPLEQEEEQEQQQQQQQDQQKQEQQQQEQQQQEPQQQQEQQQQDKQKQEQQQQDQQKQEQQQQEPQQQEQQQQPQQQPQPKQFLKNVLLYPHPNPNKCPQERCIVDVELVAISAGYRKEIPTISALPHVELEVEQRVAKMQKSQLYYTNLFSRLSNMLETLDRRYAGTEPEPQPKDLPVPEPRAASAPPLRRPRQSSDSSSTTSTTSQQEVESSEKASSYPQSIVLADGSQAYVLGKNGTQISASEYGQVFWTNAPVATRCLLTAVFTSDELATHTLTGKPSPAFYGRERPAKKMLDPLRVDDIIESVRNRTSGTERHIRATITTKCADTAKKYKRRANKALKENIVVIDE